MVVDVVNADIISLVFHYFTGHQTLRELEYVMLFLTPFNLHLKSYGMPWGNGILCILVVKSLVPEPPRSLQAMVSK